MHISEEDRQSVKCVSFGLSYSQFMHGLKLAEINVNRKMLSEIAIHDEKGFEALVDAAKKALAK